MYEDDDYYDEPRSSNEGTMIIVTIIGGFVLMAVLIYSKLKQSGV